MEEKLNGYFEKSYESVLSSLNCSDLSIWFRGAIHLH